VHKAKQAGWLSRSKNDDDGFEIGLDYIQALGKKELTAHGLVGEIAEWITATAIRPQPILSLAAALGFVGMLKGHRIAGGTDLRTNMLILSLCPSTGGKEHPQNCIKRLIMACGMEDHSMGEPTSGTGFLRAISDRGRVALWVMDEIGRYIGNASGKNAGSHQKEIIDYMIKTFSNANSVLKGREYADNKKNPTIDLVQPHFCCVGSTVQEKFSEACSSSEIIDGFLNRWVVMSVKDRGKRRDNVKFTAPPESIVNRIKALKPREYNQYDNVPLVKQVKFTPEAWDIFFKFRSDMDDKIDQVSYPLNALYGRTAEHAEKIALTLCDDNAIHVTDIKAAIAIVEYSNSCIMEFAGLISDNETEAEFLRVRDIIKKAGSIKRHHLTRKTQFIRNGNRRRNEILQDLIDTGEVKICKLNGGESLVFVEV
jgi:hypothetical protein